MDPIDWNLALCSVLGVTIQPYLAFSGLIQDPVFGPDWAVAVFSGATFPVWLIIVLRANRYLTQQRQPSLGYSTGDRVIVKGERATLDNRMLAMPLVAGDQPLLGDGADPESWWALTDSGKRICTWTITMSHLPILDRLAEL